MIPSFTFIRDNVGIYLFYAGRNRKFFDETRRNAALFLDLPGFTADSRTFVDHGRIVQSTYRAHAARKYLSRPIENPRPRAASEYSTELPTVGRRVDRSFLADVINTQILFAEISIGDVIILTPQNHYDPILLGEVQTDWNPDQVLNVEAFGEFAVPFRQVRWVPHDLSRSDFARDVARRMQNRRTVTRVDPRYYQDIFRLIYSRYIWGNSSKLDIFSEYYASNDPTATEEASFLIKYAIALYAATLINEVDQFVALDKRIAASRYFDSAIVDQMVQSFGSPGGYVARLLGSSAAIFVAGVIAIALSDEAQNVGAAQDQAVAEAQQESRPILSGAEFDPFANSLRAGTDDELRRVYGREAKAKLGLTLDGDTPPEVRARHSHSRE